MIMLNHGNDEDHEEDEELHWIDKVLAELESFDIDAKEKQPLKNFLPISEIPKFFTDRKYNLSRIN